MTPQGWEEKTLHEVLNKVKYTSKIQSKLYKDKGKYPIISQEDVFISGYWDNPSDVYYVKHPIVIFGDHTKVVKYIDFDFVLGADGVKILDPTKDINAKFLYYWTKYVPLRNLGYARHYKLLSEKTIHFPPLPEQERIVAKLDKSFEAIDKVKANAEQNLTNAKELFEKELSKVYNGCKEWSITTFDKAKVYIQRGRSPKYAEHSVLPVINQKCIRWDNLQKEHLKYVDASQFDKWGTIRYVKKDDILWNSTGTGTIGRAYLVNGTECEQAVVDSHVTIVRLNQEIINPKFAFYYIMSPIIQSKIDSLYTGSTNQVELSTSTIKDLNIQYPTLLEQQKIVEQLDKLQEQTKQLEAIYTQKIKDLNELKQSILQKAFRGEL